MDMTLEQKQALEDLAKAGELIAAVCYNPTTVVGDPESDAIAAGFEESQRSDSATLVEVVYHKLPDDGGGGGDPVLNYGTIDLSASTYNVGEEDGNLVVTLIRSAGSDGIVSVTIQTSNGTATSGVDYTAVDQSVQWADGDSANKTVNVPITSNDIADGDRTFTITISAAVGGVSLGTTTSATATIINDDVEFGPMFVYKTSDESTLLTTPLSDTDLVFTDLVAGRYAYNGVLYIVANAETTSNPGIKLWPELSTQPTLNSTGVITHYESRVGTVSPFVVVSNFSAGSPSVSFHTNSLFQDDDMTALYFSGIFIIGSTSTATIRWSKNSSNSTSITLKQGSWFSITGPFA